MLDQKGPPINNLYTFYPIYEKDNSHNGTRTIDFDFWDTQRNKNYENFSDFGGSEIEFQTQTQIANGFITYSPPLWKKNESFKSEDSPLLPQSHYYSDLSPKSRKQAIAKGRMELMEIVQNMPESAYELSLKDIVDEQRQEDQKEIVDEERGMDFKTKVQIKHKKKTTTKSGQIPRSYSMDNGTFLLKMFFPMSLTLKKKSTRGNSSKVSPGSSFGRSENHIDKNWWKKGSLTTRENKTSGWNSIGRSTSSNNSTESRHANSNFLPGCWSFFQTNKSKTRRQTGCFF